MTSIRSDRRGRRPNSRSKSTLQCLAGGDGSGTAVRASVRGKIGAQKQNRAGRLLHYNLRDRPESEFAPAGHTVRGDDDHIGVVVFSRADQFHAHVIGGADFRSYFYVFRSEAGSQVGKALRCLRGEALVIGTFFQDRYVGGQILDGRNHVDQQQFGAEARGHVRSDVHGLVRGIAEVNGCKDEFGGQHSLVVSFALVLGAREGWFAAG